MIFRSKKIESLSPLVALYGELVPGEGSVMPEVVHARGLVALPFVVRDESSVFDPKRLAEIFASEASKPPTPILIAYHARPSEPRLEPYIWSGADLWDELAGIRDEALTSLGSEFSVALPDLSLIYTEFDDDIGCVFTTAALATKFFAGEERACADFREAGLSWVVPLRAFSA